MTYGDDQRIELLERAVHDIAGIVGEIAKDRGMVATLTDIRVRFAPPETVADREEPRTHGDLSRPARPA